jgi:hypothetical protein
MTARRQAVRALKRPPAPVMDGLPMPVIEPGAHRADAAPLDTAKKTLAAARPRVKVLIMGVSLGGWFDFASALNPGGVAE